MRTYLLALLMIWSLGAAAQSMPYPDTLHPRRLRNTLIAEGTFVAGGLTVLYLNWYSNKARVPFHFYDDAKGYLQVDKVGHAYGAYLYSSVGYRSLRRAGVPKTQALWYGGGLGMYLQTPIEVFDGLYEGWGFSWSDMGANALGTGLVVAQEALLDEQIVRMKFSFTRSGYAREGYGYLGDDYFESLLNDYNGHTYWLSTGVHRWLPEVRFGDSRLAVPKWLNVAVGYGADGMYGEFENRRTYRGNRLPDVERHRQFYLALDIDWTQIPTRSPVLRGLFEGLNYVKVPLPALEYNTGGGGAWRGWWAKF